MTTTHECEYGDLELARFTGNPHRKCTVTGCRNVTIDFDDDDDGLEADDLEAGGLEFGHDADERFPNSPTPLLSALMRDAFGL
jgi:hypothetical protein